jgi:L-2-hydroxyglutarate oxidase
VTPGDSSAPHDAPEECEIAVVGGGIVGLATARELLSRRPGAPLIVLEAEAEVGLRQTGRNSGVVHAGIYYEPGSLKARLCVEGARALYDYCDGRGIRAERVGKVIVATDESELPGLDELERRGRANGVPGLRRLSAAGLTELEPHVRGIAALHSPQTGIVDFAEVARALRADVEAAGGQVRTGAAVTGIWREDGSPGAPRENRAAAVGHTILVHHNGAVRARRVVFCTGAAADRLAAKDGADPDPRIVPFRGSYLSLKPERQELVRSLVYPVPDPRLPFLGIHLTRHPRGGVLIGPTALLAPRARSLAWPGTWRLMRRHWRTGLTEISHALSRRRMVAAARRFVPELEAGDVEPGWAGERAQALGRDGTLLDDFAFSETASGLHVRNAPSPAATSSLAIARLIADRALA